MSTPATYKEWFKMLGLERGQVIFVHSSLARLRLLPRQAIELIAVWEDLLGPRGTICMPSYIWKGLPGHPPPGTVMDTKKSASQVGLLSEIFRRTPGTCRSENYWVPVCARGSLAHYLTENQSGIINAFGTGSTFRRLLEVETKLVGLGVSLNTSSLAHLPDDTLDTKYGVNVFENDLFKGEVILWSGKKQDTLSKLVRPEVLKAFRPSYLFDHSEELREQISTFNVGDANFFAYSVKTFYDEGIKIAAQRLKAGLLPPWLDDVVGFR